MRLNLEVGSGSPWCRRLRTALSAAGLVAVLAIPQTAEAQAVRGGFSAAGSQGRADDTFSGPIQIGFSINFFGTTYSSLYVGTNGYVTFDNGQTGYTPENLINNAQKIIAPFYGDIDTRDASSGLISWGSGTVNGRAAFAVTWTNVGYFQSHANKTNTFQLVIINRSDRATNDFDFEFNYNQIQWEAGDVNGGSNGLCSTSCRPPTMGYSNGLSGAANRSYEAPGSHVAGAFIDTNAQTGLKNQQVGGSGVNGRWLFTVSNGSVSGGGSGGTGGVAVRQGPVFTTAVADPLNNCPSVAPAAGTFRTTDPVVTVWMVVGLVSSPTTILSRFSFNGQPQTQLDLTWSFGSTSQNYSICPAFAPGAGSAGNWTLTLYLNGNTSNVITVIPFTVTAGGSGGSNVTVTASPVMTTIHQSACTATPPSPGKSSFLTSDPNITHWVSIAGLTLGDLITVTYTGPGGIQYTGRANAAWTSLWACFTLPPSPANTPTGSWAVTLSVNNQPIPGTTAQFTLSGSSTGSGGGSSGGLATGPSSSGASSSASVYANPVMTTNHQSTCSSAVPSPTKTNFLTTDPYITHWVAITGATVGSSVTVTYSGPNGTRYTGQGTTNWTTFWACFTLPPLPSTAPTGNWSVALSVNDQPVPGTTVQFTLTGSSTGTGAGTGTGPISTGQATGGGGGGGGGGVCTASSPNVARSGVAAASSMFTGDGPNFSNPGNLINGVLEPDYGFSTNLEVNPWWQVDLGSTQALCEVRVYNRAGGFFERTRTIRILTSTDGTNFVTAYTHSGVPWGDDAARSPLSVPLTGSLTGAINARFLRVQLGEAGYLNLREVEVYAVGSGGGGGGGPVTLTVTGSADIFAAGLPAVPPNMPGGGGTLPVSYTLPAGSAGQVLTVTNVTGTINFGGGPVPSPDGLAMATFVGRDSTGVINYTPVPGSTIGGIENDRQAVFLTGVFLSGSQPASAPASLVFDSSKPNSLSSTSASFPAPQLGQPFFVGDGLTGTGTGTVQQFVIPQGATQFYLGIVDGFSPNPGYYNDNSGSLTATVQVGAPSDGGGGGGGGNPPPTTSTGCSYQLQPLGDLLREPAAGTVDVINVVTGPNCKFAAYSPDSWVHPTPTALTTAGAANCGTPGGPSLCTGAVTLQIDENRGAQRTSILTVAGQQVTLTQLAGSRLTPCTYTLSATNSQTFAYEGGTGSVSVTVAGSQCLLQAAVDPAVPATQQWAQIASSATFSTVGVKTISYQVNPNNTTSARSIRLILTGTNPSATLPYTISQAAGPANTSPPPTISPGGVTNAASFITGGPIAQGSFFSIFGTNMGPPNPGVKAPSFPLQTTLEGVSVAVTGGGITVQAIPVFAAQFQINAIMPSNAPLGDVQIRATYNGVGGPPQRAKVVTSAFGAFAVSLGRGPGIVQNALADGSRPLNTTITTAPPNGYVIVWGTGLGPLSQSLTCPGATVPDQCDPNTSFVPQVSSIQVFVGGVQVNLRDQFAYAARAPNIAGVDQVQFPLPPNTPLGCYVPVQVVVNGNLFSNTVTMATNNNGQPCVADTPLSRLPREGGKNALLLLARLNSTGSRDSSLNGVIDLGVGELLQQPPGGPLAFDPFASTPPVGTCSYYNNIDLGGLLGGQLPSVAGASYLNGGASISVRGPNGTQSLIRPDNTSPYIGLLGGALSPSSRPFLDPGEYAISSPGGPDLGAFSFSMNVGAPAALSTQVSTVDRSQPLVVNWTGGNSANQNILIMGYARDSETRATGAFICIADPNARTFSVPPGMMANLPPTQGNSNATGVLLLLTSPSASSFVTFSSSAPVVDHGVGMYLTGDIRVVDYK